MRARIESGLSASLPNRLVKELLDAHAEAKEKFYLGGLRLSEVEGGRFCEAAFRILQHITTGSFDPLGHTLDTDRLIRNLSQLPSGSHPDSIRLHIPRTLRVVYDIRNKRDAAHLADGIDPNVQDATFVVSSIDWVLAELVRLYHNVSPDEATKIVDALVSRNAPAIEEFNGFLKSLRPNLQASDLCVLLLYQRDAAGATFDQIEEWVHPKMRANLNRTLTNLVENKAFAHFNGDKYVITRLGRKYAEQERLLD